MRIVTVEPGDRERIAHMARLLVDGFSDIAPDAWPTLDDALDSVTEVLERGFCRAAQDESGAVVGWVGGLPQYEGHVWELHPLVVARTAQGQGFGRGLVLDFEAQVKERGGLTILLGSDDQAFLTSLSGIDLYDDLPGKLAQAQGSRPHPLEFYRSLGYTLVGVVPDANGIGKPDILMAKRV